MRSVFSFVVVILFLLLGNQVLVAKGLLDDSTNRTRKEQEEEEEDPLASSSPSSHSSSSSHDDENHPINNGTYYYKKGKLSNDVVVNYHREKFERTNRFLELMHDIVDGEKEEEDTRYVVKVSSRKKDTMTCRRDDELCSGGRDPSSRNNRCMVGWLVDEILSSHEICMFVCTNFDSIQV